MLVAVATVLGIVPFIGPLIYMLFRPPEYLEDVRERELEIKAMEKRLGGRDLHCPVCRAEVDEDFLICPVCTTKLRQSCVSCHRPLEALWQVCPYCETPIEHDPTTVQLTEAQASAAPPAKPLRSLRDRMAVEQTLILAKPDAVARNLAGEILARFERRGLKLRAARLVTATREVGETHYAEHQEKPFFGELVDFITSGPTLAFVLEGEGAIATCRKTIGATNPADADPGSLRGSFALAMPNNLVHGSDSPESAAARDRDLVPRRSGLRLALWSDDAAKNAALWTETNREHTDDSAPANWALDEISWGIWAIDESELNVLPDVDGLDVVELGCGTAYFSAWLAKRGARPVGVDITPAQLATARRMMAETGIEFPLVEADAARDRAAAESFDLVMSEYGASIWVDPYRWIPEAARLLRPGRPARLPAQLDARDPLLADDEVPASETLQRPQFGMHRFEWPDGRRRVPSAARRVDRPPARERLRDRAARRAPGAGRRADARVLRAT